MVAIVLDVKAITITRVDVTSSHAGHSKVIMVIFCYGRAPFSYAESIPHGGIVILSLIGDFALIRKMKLFARKGRIEVKAK